MRAGRESGRRRVRGGRVSWVLAAGLALGEQVGAAQPSAEGSPLPIRLTVDAPAGCPDRAAFLAQVKAYAARAREALPGEAAREIHAAMRPGDDGFVGTLTMTEPDGTEGRREVHDVDCGSLSAGMAFVAAVVIDPNVARSATPPPVVPPPQEPPVRHEPPARLSAGVAFAAIEGLGPGTQVDPRGFVDLELPGPLHRFDVRASLGRAFTNSVVRPSGTARITLTDLRLEPCFDLVSPGALGLRVCGMVDGVVLAGQGTGTNDPTAATRRSIELGLGVRPTWVVGRRFVLGVFAGAAVPLRRYRFKFSLPDETAYELATWSGVVELSAGVYFW
jgi:hypothetical protein